MATTIEASQLSSSSIPVDDSFVGRLNITTSGEQQNPVVTGLSNGNFIVVWADRAGNDGSEGGIFAQIYTSQFEAVGEEFIVNSYTDHWQSRPEVSSTSSGDFLVTWAEGNGYLSAQFFNQSGAQIGEQFNMRPGWNHHADIAVSADGGFWVSGNVAQDAIYIKKISSDGIDLIADVKIDRDVFQADPTITILLDQRVLVTWNEETETGSNDIYAQLVSDSGVLLGEAFLINQNISNNQLGQEVTALIDGGFAITWQSENQDGDGYGIIVRQFDNELNGTDEIIVNEITLGNQTDPTITADSEGGFLVGWTDNIHINGGAVYAQRFDTAANKIGSNIHLNDDGVIDLNNSKDVEIAELQDGSFVAAWDAWSGTRDIYARKIADEEVQPILPIDDSFVGRLNITTSGEQQNPVVTGLSNGNFIVVWADRAGNDGSEGGIFAQIYTSQFEAVGEEFIVNSYTDHWQSRPEVSSTSSGDFLVTWAEGNGYLSAQFFNQSGAQIGEQFNMRPGWNHHADIAVSADGGFWVSGNVAQDAIYIKKISSDGIDLIADVKIDRDVFQADPTITILLDQRVLVTWNEETETGSNDIYAQLVSDSGVLLGEAFLINQNISNNQLGQEVTALIDGGFAITWQSENQDGDGYGIIVRQFDNELNGTDEIIVNEITLGNQTDPTITADSEGGFLVGWTDNIHINGGAVYAQRFDTAANKIGSNIHLNDDGVIDLNNSKDVEIVELQDGSFVAAWDAWSGTRDIYARKIADEEVQPTAPGHTFSVKALDGKYVIDGEVAPSLELVSGRTYEFDLSDPSLASHPLKFKEGGTLVDGSVRYDGTLGVDQVVTLTVPSMTDGVGVMSYYCTNHSGMGNDIEIKFNDVIGTNTDDVLTGLSGSDWIEGLNGDDTIDGSSGQDYVDGGEGHDTLYGGAENDTLDGGAGNDTIDGGAGNDTIDGGAGNDTIDGGAGNDTIDGGTGNDTLLGGYGNDALTGGAGDNTLDGGDGEDTLNGGAGDDTLLGDGAYAAYTFNAILTKLDQDWTAIDLKRVELTLGLNNDTPFKYSNGEIISFFGGEVVRMEIEHGNLYDTISFAGHNSSYEAYQPIISEYSNLSDERYIIIEQGFNLDGVNHSLLFEIYSEGDHYDNILTLDDWFDNSQRKSQDLPIIADYKAGATISLADASSQSLAQKKWVHTASNGAGDDTLDGGAGNDTLSGGAGNDTLDGGEGSDTLDGGSGDDIIYGGDGNDIISDGLGNDTLRGGAGNDIFINYGNTDTFDGGEGTDRLFTKLDDEYIASIGLIEKQFTVGLNLEAGKHGQFDTTNLQFTGVGLDTLISVEDFEISGNFDIYAIGDSNANTIIGDEGNDTIDGGDGDDTLDGGEGNDTLHGSGGNDRLEGAGGNDTLDGGSGDDIIYGGDGNDIISDGLGNDTLRGGAGNDIFINYGNTDTFDGGEGTDRLFTKLDDEYIASIGLIEKQFTVGLNLEAGKHGQFDTTNLQFTGVGLDTLISVEDFEISGNFDIYAIGDSNANTIIGDEGNDTIDGGDGDDTLDGGEGNDTLHGSGGNDRLEGAGGNDTLDGGSGDDTLHGGTGNDTLSAWIGNDKVYAGAGNDTIINTGGEDLFDGGEGVDTLVTDLSQSVKDELGFSNWDFDIVLDLNADDPHMRHYALTPDGTDYAWDEVYGIENYTLIGDFDAELTGDDEANILVSDTGDDVIRGGAGDDTLNGGAGDDTLDGGAGDDTINDGAGTDIINGGDGTDTLSRNLSDDYSDYAFTPIIDLNSGKFYAEEYPDDYDTLISMENLQVAGNFNYTLKGDNADNILTAGAGNDTLVGGFGNDTLYGGSGNDTLDGDNGDDIISGGMGDDYLTAGDGNDSLFGGDGDDALHDDWGGNDHFDGGEGTDSLFLPTKSSGASIDVQAGTVKSYFNPPQWSETPAQDEVDTFVSIEIFGGTAYNDTFVGSDGDETFYGFDGNDTLYGGSGNDTLSGGAGNDTLDGGAGNDTMYGGAGDDTYVFEFQGNDTVIDSSGNDIVAADTKGDNGELRFRQLYQSNDQLVLEGSRENTDSKISMSGVESIKWGVIDGGYTMTLGVSGETSDVTNSMYVGTLSNDTLITGQGAYVEGYGADGDDTITVLGGSSWVTGDGGNDTLIGGEGNDTLKGDYTSGDAGHDTLYGNGGNDTLSGNAGNDTLTGGSGSDTFQFHGVFEHDTITDYDSDEDILEFYANDGSALNISDLIETVNSDGNRVLSTADGLSSVTLEGSAGITPVPGGLAMSVVSQDGDVVTFGIFADPITDPDEDGIGSFDFTLNHDALDMQIDAGSLVFATGLSGLQNYDADSGTLTAGAFTLNNVEDLDAPLLTFEATMLDTKAPISIQITDIVVDGDDFASTTEVFDFSALAITTTITDRFGNAMTSAEAQAYEASVNEITATSTTDNVTVFETASGSDLLIDAAMAIDTASDKAIGAFDALQALRLAVGLDKSDGSSEWHDYIAADINKDGRVGADDALNILKFAVGLTDGPSADWVFVDGDADYSAIDRKNTDYDEGVLISDVVTDLSINMTGILVGDVDGSYIA